MTKTWRPIPPQHHYYYPATTTGPLRGCNQQAHHGHGRTTLPPEAVRKTEFSESQSSMMPSATSWRSTPIMDTDRRLYH